MGGARAAKQCHAGSGIQYLCDPEAARVVDAQRDGGGAGGLATLSRSRGVECGRDRGGAEFRLAGGEICD